MPETLVITMPDKMEVLVQHWREEDLWEIAIRNNRGAVWCPVELAGGTYRIEQ